MTREWITVLIKPTVGIGGGIYGNDGDRLGDASGNTWMVNKFFTLDTKGNLWLGWGCVRVQSDPEPHTLISRSGDT